MTLITISRSPALVTYAQGLQKDLLANLTGLTPGTPFHELLKAADARHGIMGVGYGSIGPGPLDNGLRIYVRHGWNTTTFPTSFNGAKVKTIPSSPFRFSAKCGGLILSDQTDGCLGCVGKVNNKNGNYLLTCSHVFGFSGLAAGMDVYDGMAVDGHGDPIVVGSLEAFESPIKDSLLGASQGNTMDAAIALLSQEVTPGFSYGNLGVAHSEVAQNTSVCKQGPTTGTTFGTIVDLSMTFHMTLPNSYTFTDQMVVAGTGGPFCDNGDSGSLVVTSQGLNPVGLLFARDSDQNAIVTPIDRILTQFGFAIS